MVAVIAYLVVAIVASAVRPRALRLKPFGAFDKVVGPVAALVVRFVALPSLSDLV